MQRCRRLSGIFAHVSPEPFVALPCSGEPRCSEAILCLDGLFRVLQDAIAVELWFLPGGCGALDIDLAMPAGWYPEKDGLPTRNAALAQRGSATEASEVYTHVRGTGPIPPEWAVAPDPRGKGPIWCLWAT